MASPRALQCVQLATQLPTRLTRFFARYPPQFAGAVPPTSPSTAIHTEESLTSALQSRSPFRPWKSFNGVWRGPAYSLRRQADLLRLARAHGVEELMPPSVKSLEERARKREEHGLRVRGTGVGQRPKGKAWERHMKGKLQKRRTAMLEMPLLIQTWKQKGHGRGWKKWPSGKAD